VSLHLYLHLHLQFTNYAIFRSRHPLSRLVGFPGSVGMARLLIKLVEVGLSFCMEAFVVYGSSFVDRADI